MLKGITPKYSECLENLENLFSGLEQDSTSNAQSIFKVPALPTTKSTPKSSKDDLIAKRTRSRLPMTDVELEELEAMFQPPDFEPTIFSLDEMDDEELIWQGWLADLLKPAKAALNDTNDDENDEDFNYMAAAEEETEVG